MSSKWHDLGLWFHSYVFPLLLSWNPPWTSWMLISLCLFGWANHISALLERAFVLLWRLTRAVTFHTFIGVVVQKDFFYQKSSNHHLSVNPQYEWGLKPVMDAEEPEVNPSLNICLGETEESYLWCSCWTLHFFYLSTITLLLKNSFSIYDDYNFHFFYL